MPWNRQGLEPCALEPAGFGALCPGTGRVWSLMPWNAAAQGSESEEVPARELTMDRTVLKLFNEALKADRWVWRLGHCDVGL